MQLIVTRPLAQADAWVAALRELGVMAQALPLIRIAPPDDEAAVEQAWHRLQGLVLVMFVSANAVAQFFRLRPVDAPWPAALQAAATGPGTAAALREAGLLPAQIVEPAGDAPSFDSEALWARLSGRPWPGCRVLVVRGEEGRDWLAEQLGAQGAQVDFVAAYRRLPPQPDAAQQDLLACAQADPQGHLWVFSSSEAVGHLAALASGADWSAGRALASHVRIAQAARNIGFGQVQEVAPNVAAVAVAAAMVALDDVKTGP